MNEPRVVGHKRKHLHHEPTVDTVQAALHALALAPIEFSPDDECYVLPGIGKKRGLTKILNALIPVPHGELDDEVPTKKARRSKNDPKPDRRVWRATPDTNRYLRRAVAQCRDAVGGCQLDQFGDDEGRAGIGAAYHKRHGSLVDEQIKLRVAHGSAALDARDSGAMRGGLDPCTATLLDFVAARGRRIVAAQVPLYSKEMDVATAFDIMTDDGTVYEIKSNAVATPDAIARSDKSYETPRARLTRTALRGAPCSQYTRGQVQLYVTCAMIAEMTGWQPPGAAVLRVSPGVVREYPLNAWFKERADKFRRAFAQKTGQHKRNLRDKRHKQFNGSVAAAQATTTTTRGTAPKRQKVVPTGASTTSAGASVGTQNRTGAHV